MQLRAARRAMKVRVANLILVAGDGFRARTMLARVTIFVKVGKSELGSFRSFRVGGRRSTSSWIVGRAIRDYGQSRQIRVGFVSQFFRVGGRYAASGSTLAARFVTVVKVGKSELGSFRSHHDVGLRRFADAWLTFCLH